MFAWLWFFTPPPPPPESDTAADTTDTVTAVEDPAPAPVSENEDEEELPETRELQAVADSSLAGALEGEESFVTVETEIYTARFSTKGATPVSFELKEYKKAHEDAPVQLVDTSGAGALSMLFTTPQSHVVDTRSLYFTPSFEGDTLRVGDDETAEIAFTANLGGGTLRYVYSFEGDEYAVDLQVVQDEPRSYSMGDGYELVWNGGVPFSEDRAEEETRTTSAFAYSGGELIELTLTDDDYEERSLRGDVSWVSVKTKYFTSVIMPEQPRPLGAFLEGELEGARETPSVWEDYTVGLRMPSSSGTTDAYTLYLGPMEYWRISGFGKDLYAMVDYGWDFFEFLTVPIAKYVFIPSFTGLAAILPSYGLVIIIFAFLLKMLLLPLTKSSYRSMARMRELQPKMEAIKEQHGDDPQKQQEAMMKMYKETGVNPVGGCVPMLLQYPILIALWQYLPQSIQIRQESFLWANDLSVPDVILSLPFEIPFYGDYVAGFTLLMGLSMVVQMRFQMSASSGAQAKIFMYVMPLFLFVIFNQFAAGLSLYYLTYNIVTAFQQKFINDQLENEKQEDVNGKGSKKDARLKKGKPKKKAKA